jgi:polyhydroxyalkanoate synthesis regulator phasin
VLILLLKVVTYEWNEFINTVRDGYELNVPIIGFIAQELEKVVPELVSKWKLNDDCQDARAVDYQRVVPVLVEAMKEQQKQIEDLKNRVKALENK